MKNIKEDLPVSESETQTIASGNRIFYLDVLRVLSAFGVVWLHVSILYWWRDNWTFSTEWMISNVYESCVRWCVPVFVMISGALFLDSKKNLNIKRLYTKNVAHILQAYILWSIIYAFGITNNFDIISILKNIIKGPFHFWYLKMLIGVYLVIPVLKAIVSNKQAEVYFLCVAAITCFVIPPLFPIISHMGDSIKAMAEGWTGLNIMLGYTGYFVLGHFLNTYKFNLRIKRAIYILGGLSIICVISFTYLISVHNGQPSELFYNYLTPFSLFEAAAVFLLFSQNGNNIPIKYHSVIIHLSKMSFGIFLVHILVINIMIKIGINFLAFHPALFIPCFSFIVFSLSYIITRLLSHIPYLKILVN